MRYVGRYAAELPVLAERLGQIEMPVLNLRGRSPIDAGHFAREEEPDEFAALIANSVTAGWRTQGPCQGPDQ